jgi:hypothetical protein
MRGRRILQILVTSVFALAAIATALAGAPLAVVGVASAMACAAFLSWEIQIRSLKAAGARVRARASRRSRPSSSIDPGRFERGTTSA